jgi:hypothetical protein
MSFPNGSNSFANDSSLGEFHSNGLLAVRIQAPAILMCVAVARAIARSSSTNLGGERAPRFYPMLNGFHPRHRSGPAAMAMRIKKCASASSKFRLLLAQADASGRSHCGQANNNTCAKCWVMFCKCPSSFRGLRLFKGYQTRRQEQNCIPFISRTCPLNDRPARSPEQQSGEHN